MKFLRYVLPVLAATTIAGQGFADSYNENRMMNSIRQWVDSKQDVSVRDKSADLSISGDVRLRYVQNNEKVAGTRTTGSGNSGSIAPTGLFTTTLGGIPTAEGTAMPNSHFVGEFNLVMDYSADRAWTSVWLQFHSHLGNNAREDFTSSVAGVPGNNLKFGGGNKGGLDMRQAYMGYRVLDEGSSVLDVIAGRVVGYNMFDSRVQFGSNFDGLFVKYANAFEDVGDFFVHGGGFVVDAATDWYGWIGEAGLMDIVDSGFSVKYSFTSWSKKGRRNAYLMLGDQLVGTLGIQKSATPMGDQFRVSQLSASYDFDPEMLGMDARVFAAYGFNSSAKKGVYRANKRDDKFWYAGASVGALEKAGDWALEAQYQRVGAQSMPAWDASGAGRGTTATMTAAGGATGYFGMGLVMADTNYKGWMFNGSVLLTDNLSLGLQYWSTRTASKVIQSKTTFNRFMGELTYAF